MKNSTKQLCPGAAVACFLALTLAALAQEKTPPPSPPAAPETSTAATPAAAAPTAEPAPAPAPPAPAAAATPAPTEEKTDPALRRIDEPTPGPQPTAPKNQRRPGRNRGIEGLHINHDNDNAVVSVAHDSFLGQGEKADAVVSILGSSTSEGEVGDSVVSVLGNSRATGTVGNAVVAVLGNTYVNGKVGDAVVAVLGDVELGPEAEVGGDVVSVGGTVKRDPKTIIHGSVQNVAVGGVGFAHADGLRTWFRECLMLGRPLALARGIGFAWTIAILVFALYALLALLFRDGVEKCVTTLETRPGSSILTAVLSILLIPVVLVLLCVTIVGIAAVPFVALGLLIAGLFGKTVMLAWVGRRFTKFFGEGPLNHPAVAVVIGGVIVLALYCVPFVGIVVQKSFDLLGLGVVIYTLILANKREKPTPPRPPAAPTTPLAPMPSVPPTPPAMPLSSPGFGATNIVSGDPMTAGAAAAAPVPPPPLAPTPAPAAAFMSPSIPTMRATPPLISAATNVRAGFLIRLAALALDFILWAIIWAMIDSIGRGLHLRFPVMLLWLAIYGAVMWKLKGTTIGGVICGLKVVRLDDREIDWGTAIVRALGCFLSLAVVGLGFLWVAIDDDKQSWHDKIAGTTVVRVPKGVSLI